MAGLLDLSAEVRVMIYLFLFPQDHYYVEDRRSAPFNLTNVHSGILRVNSVLTLEALPILYSRVIFHIQATRKAVQWLRQIGQINRDLLRKVTCSFWLKMPYRCERELFGLLARCSSISLTVNMYSIEDLMWLDNSDIGRFKSMHGFASVSIDCKPWTDFICSQGHRSQADYEVLQHRLDSGILIMESPCPHYCWAHRGQSRNQARASLHFWFQCRPCVTCTFKEAWYETTNPDSIFKPW